MTEPPKHWTELRDAVQKYEATLYKFILDPSGAKKQDVENDQQDLIETACTFVSLNHPELP